MAKANPFRFSTKYQDDETDLLWYGHRYYTASAGSWLSRDRAPGRRDLNLYAFTRNSPVNSVDYLGLDTMSTCQQLANAANSGRYTGNSRIDELLKKLNAEPTCTFHITCAHCNSPSAQCKSSKAQNGGGVVVGVNTTVTVCVDRLQETDVAHVILHELVHALQDCHKNWTADCSSCLCRELEAYKAEYPDLSDADLQRKATDSCTTPGTGPDGASPACGSNSKPGDIMTPAFTKSCESSGRPPGAARASATECLSCGT